MHQRCWSLAQYDRAVGTDLANMLLISKRVDLVLTGHEHLHQRTEQLAIGGSCRRWGAVGLTAYFSGSVTDGPSRCG